MVMVRNWSSADIARHLITLGKWKYFFLFFFFVSLLFLTTSSFHNHIPILYSLLSLIPHPFLFFYPLLPFLFFLLFLFLLIVFPCFSFSLHFTGLSCSVIEVACLPSLRWSIPLGHQGLRSLPLGHQCRRSSDGGGRRRMLEKAVRRQVRNVDGHGRRGSEPRRHGRLDCSGSNPYAQFD